MVGGRRKSQKDGQIYVSGKRTRPTVASDGEEAGSWSRSNGQQFGGGAHICIGRNLALLEINKAIPRLLRDFTFELVHPGEDLKVHASFFVVQEGLDVYIEKRASLFMDK